jgi:hypothetical protein
MLTMISCVSHLQACTANIVTRKIIRYETCILTGQFLQAQEVIFREWTGTVLSFSCPNERRRLAYP